MLLEDILMYGHTVMTVLLPASPLSASEAGLASISVEEDDVLGKLEDLKVQSLVFIPNYHLPSKDICVSYQN